MQEETFFQLLVEVLGIEFTILLRDALAPFHAASASSDPITSSVPEDMDLTGGSSQPAGNSMYCMPARMADKRILVASIADERAQTGPVFGRAGQAQDHASRESPSLHS